MGVGWRGGLCAWTEKTITGLQETVWLSPQVEMVFCYLPFLPWAGGPRVEVLENIESFFCVINATQENKEDFFPDLHWGLGYAITISVAFGGRRYLDGCLCPICLLPKWFRAKVDLWAAHRRLLNCVRESEGWICDLSYFWSSKPLSQKSRPMTCLCYTLESTKKKEALLEHSLDQQQPKSSSEIHRLARVQISRCVLPPPTTATKNTYSVAALLNETFYSGGNVLYCPVRYGSRRTTCGYWDWVTSFIFLIFNSL